MTNREKIDLLNEIAYEFGTANYQRIKGNEERVSMHVEAARALVRFARNNKFDPTIYRTNDGEIYACLEAEINNKKVFVWITSCNIARDNETMNIVTEEIKAWHDVGEKCYYINCHDTLTEWTIA